MELGDQSFHPRRVGVAVDAVDRRHATALEQLRDLLVGENHQPLDQAVGLGLRHGAGTDDFTGTIEAELGLGALDREPAPIVALPAEARCRVAGQRQRLGDPLGRGGATGEDHIELVVVEAGVGPDPAAIEGGVPGRSGRVEVDLGGDRQPLDPRREAAGVLAQRPRKHRLDGAGNVGAVSAPPRLAVERRARADVCGDVGNVDPEPGCVTLAACRDRIVEIARRRRVDGEGRQPG